MTTELETLYDQRVFIYDDCGKENAPIARMTPQSATKGKEHRRNEAFPARTRHHGSSARVN